MKLTNITVTFIDPSDGYREDYQGAVLIDEETAIYAGDENGEMYLGYVLPTGDSERYLVDNDRLFLDLGYSLENHDETISRVAEVLQKMSAMELIKKVLLKIPEQIDFREFIVPGLIQNN